MVVGHQFHRDGALPGDHVLIVVGWIRCGLHAQQLHAMRRGIVVGIAVQHGPRAEGFHRAELDLRRGGGHHDDGIQAQMLCAQRHTLRMVAADGQHAARVLPLKAAPAGVCAAQFEREHRLLVFALSRMFSPSRRDSRRAESRRALRHVVDRAVRIALSQALASSAAGAGRFTRNRARVRRRIRRPALSRPRLRR